ncbi:MAG: cell division FtsA domain-containing protein, partial [Clostridia bacterium]|nr:cell division FtsA domain-containing protein [Clostridia bacterium]
LIDVGGSKTEFCAYFKKSIYFASAIPVGGDNITNDVAQVLNVRREEAEGLKRDYCIADTGLVNNNVDVAIFSLSSNQQELIKVHDIVEIMQARIEDILRLIRNKLDAEDIQTDLIDRVIFTGDGIVSFSGLNEVCQRVLGTKQVNVDFSRYTYMKSTYTYASGMVMHVSPLLDYGMKQSAIEKVQAQQEPAKGKGKGLLSSFQDKFKDLVDRLRD